jgi:hypothetical protein
MDAGVASLTRPDHVEAKLAKDWKDPTLDKLQPQRITRLLIAKH